MGKEIQYLIIDLENNFAIGQCEKAERTCADCRATSLVKELKWLLSLQD